LTGHCLSDRQYEGPQHIFPELFAPVVHQAKPQPALPIADGQLEGATLVRNDSSDIIRPGATQLEPTGYLLPDFRRTFGVAGTGWWRLLHRHRCCC
jgi:hypothetical protein